MIRVNRMLLILIITFFAMSDASAYDVQVTKDITYAVYDDVFLKLDIYQPKGLETKTPVVIAIHGGSWVKGDKSIMADFGNMLASQGYAVISPSYRLAPKFIYPAQIEDIRAAARWIEANTDRFNLDSKRIVALGKSAGGQLAALLAVQNKNNVPNIIAVVDFYGPMDFTVKPPRPIPEVEKIASTYLGSTQEKSPKLYAEASPITHVSPEDPPFMIIHGTQDRTVPLSQSKAMVEALKKNGVPVVFYPMEGIGHNTPAFDTPEGKKLADMIIEFLTKYAGKPVVNK